MSFGDRLKQIRYQLGLNQQKMAARLNMEQSTYSRYENGKTKATSDMIVRVSEDFEVSTDWLLGKSNIENMTLHEARQTYERAATPVSRSI